MGNCRIARSYQWRVRLIRPADLINQETPAVMFFRLLATFYIDYGIPSHSCLAKTSVQNWWKILFQSINSIAWRPPLNLERVHWSPGPAANARWRLAVRESSSIIYPKSIRTRVQYSRHDSELWCSFFSVINLLDDRCWRVLSEDWTLL